MSSSNTAWWLLAFVGFLTYQNIVWSQTHLLPLPPPWDQGLYLTLSLRYLHAWQDDGVSGLVSVVLHGHPYVAPLLPLTTLPWYLLIGPSRLVAYLTNALYLLLLCVGVYALGRHVYHRRVGVLAAIVTATATVIVLHARDYLMDFPAACVVTVGLYALIRAEACQHRGWSLLCGALMGLAVLTKTMAGVFFLGPILYVGVSIVRTREGLRSRLLTLTLTAMVAGAIAGLWWGPNWRTALGFLLEGGFGKTAAPYRQGDVWTLANLGYYPLAFVNEGISIEYTMLMGGLVIWGIVHAGRRRIWRHTAAGTFWSPRGALWVWVLSGYVILTVTPLKWPRYSQALIPPVVLLTVGGLSAIPRRWLRRSVVVTMLLSVVLNYLAMTYEPLRSLDLVYVPPTSVRRGTYRYYNDWWRPTGHHQWPHEEIIERLAQLSVGLEEKRIARLRFRVQAQGEALLHEGYVRLLYHGLLGREPDEGGYQQAVAGLNQGFITREGLLASFVQSPEFRARPPRVLVVPDHPLMNPATLQYYATRHRYAVIFDRHLTDDPLTHGQLQAYDYILVKTGGYQGPEFSTRYATQINAELRTTDTGFLSLRQTFPFPETVADPGPSEIKIYVIDIGA